MNQRVLIEKNYLRIPIRKDAVEKNVWLYQELTAVLQFQAGLFVDYGSGAPDFYAELPVERWKGSVLTLVHEEDRPVCAPLYNRGKKTPLFDISYYGRKINLEVFHALTDGAGAFEFMRTILYYSVTYRHPAQFQDEPPMLDYDASTSHRKEDSFRRYGEKGKSMKFRNPRKAYWLRGTRPKPYRYRVIEGIASCSELLT